MSLPVEPDGTLRHSGADPEHEERGYHTDPEHHPPPEIRAMIKQRVDIMKYQRRENETPGKPSLKQTRSGSPPMRRPVFEGQRHAGRPFASHPDSEKRAESK